MLDQYTKEAVAVFILLKRLGFTVDEIATHNFELKGFGIILQTKNTIFPLALGPALISYDLFKGRWQNACRKIELGLWSETKVQRLMDSTSIPGRGAQVIVDALIHRNLLDAATEITNRAYKREMVDRFGKKMVSFKLQKKEQN
jgi:hypothetical protein